MVSSLNQPVIELTLEKDTGSSTLIEMDRQGLRTLIEKLKEALDKTQR